MRAVIDTNVLMAALLAELADVIRRAKFDAILTRTNTSRERSLQRFGAWPR